MGGESVEGYSITARCHVCTWTVCILLAGGLGPVSAIGDGSLTPANNNMEDIRRLQN